MSNVAFDQLLQIVAPSAETRLAPAKDSSNGEGFRAHLDRAAEVADAKTKDVPKESSPPKEEDENLTVSSGQQENATTENEDTTDRIEAEQSDSEQPTDDTTSTDVNPEDEVTLSAAAAVQTTAQTLDEHSGYTTDASAASGEEQPAQATASDSQDQPNQNGTQPPQLLPAKADESFSIDVPTEAAPTEAKVQGNEANLSEVVETPLTSSQASNDTSGQIVAATAVAHEQGAALNKSSQPSKNTSNLTSPINSEGELSLPQAEADATPTTPTNTSTPTPPPTQSTTAEIELVTTDLPVSPEAHAAVPTPTAASSGSELIASVEKATHLLATSKADGSQTGRSEQTQDTPTVDRVRFVQRVGGAIRSAQQRDGQIQLRLSPPELGTLRIQLTVNEGAITANLETESSAARTVLLENLPALRERLAEQGITIEKFDVDVGREGGQQANNSPDEERDSNQPRNDRDSNQESTARETPAVSTATAKPDITSDSGLDVEV